MNTKGFSLLELMSALLIMLILFFWSWPSMSQMGRSLCVTTSGNLITDSLLLARQEAITKGIITAVVFDWRERQFAVYRLPRNTDTNEDYSKTWEMFINWTRVKRSVTFDQNSPSSRVGLAAWMPARVSDFVMYGPDGTRLGPEHTKAIRIFDPKNPNNYYKAIVLGATGLVKVDRADP